MHGWPLLAIASPSSLPPHPSSCFFTPPSTHHTHTRVPLPCRHAILISPQAEMELGRQTFEQVLAEAAVAGSLLPKNHRATQAVQRVGMRVAKVSGCRCVWGWPGERPVVCERASGGCVRRSLHPTPRTPHLTPRTSRLPRPHPGAPTLHPTPLLPQAATDGYGGGFQGHLQGLRWEFAVVDSPQVNAFVVPGGKVVVYTGGRGRVVVYTGGRGRVVGRCVCALVGRRWTQVYRGGQRAERRRAHTRTRARARARLHTLTH